MNTATNTAFSATIDQTRETIFVDADSRIIAEQCARGEYQHRLVRGVARWSGADLRGKASKYAGHYSRSRDSLVHKMRSAGLTVMLVKGANDRIIAIVSYDPITVETAGKRSERVLRIAA